MKKSAQSAEVLPTKRKRKSTLTGKYYAVSLPEYEGDLSGLFDFNSRLSMEDVLKRERAASKKANQKNTTSVLLLPLIPFYQSN